jgi:CRISPR-associated protein Cas1
MLFFHEKKYKKTRKNFIWFPDEDMQPYYILSSGKMRRDENTLLLEKENGESKVIPIENIDAIHLLGQITLNRECLVFLGQQGKPLHVYNYYGFYSGSFYPRQKNVSGELLVHQVEHYLDNEKRLYLAFSFVEGAIFHARRNLREHSNTESTILKLEKELEYAGKTKSISELMGCEGRAKEAYYQAFNLFLNEEFYLGKREKRPPSNPINALISFGNSLIYSTILSEIYKTQLNPTISYLHEPRERRFSLSLDLAEIFKPLIVDAIIFRLVNNNMIKLDDFEKNLGGCYLNENGRKKFIETFDSKLETTIKHRKLKRKVSYRTILRLECYKLIKHLLNDEIYVPFKAWW